MRSTRLPATHGGLQPLLSMREDLPGTFGNGLVCAPIAAGACRQELNGGRCRQMGRTRIVEEVSEIPKSDLVGSAHPFTDTIAPCILAQSLKVGLQSLNLIENVFELRFVTGFPKFSDCRTLRDIRALCRGWAGCEKPKKDNGQKAGAYWP